MTEKELKSMVEQLITQMVGTGSQTSCNSSSTQKTQSYVDPNGCIEDITTVDLKKQLLVKNPVDAAAYLQMKSKTPARIGIGRAGARYKTETALRVRADHAAAQDSVFSDVAEEFVKKNNFIPIQTQCEDKDQYLTRPDYGRKFPEEAKQIIKQKCGNSPKVQVVVGDGLSSAAIEANIEDIIPALKQGLQVYGITLGEIIFVKYCRVPAMDEIGELTGADVVCLFVGERPGLVTAESMSAYIAYKPTIGMPEAKRTVVSNIHKGGTNAVEAGAHVAELIKTMLDKKASGIDLK